MTPFSLCIHICLSFETTTISWTEECLVGEHYGWGSRREAQQDSSINVAEDGQDSAPDSSILRSVLHQSNNGLQVVEGRRKGAPNYLMSVNVKQTSLRDHTSTVEFCSCLLTSDWIRVVTVLGGVGKSNTHEKLEPGYLAPPCACRLSERSMRSIANLLDHVLTQYRWHSFASKALRLVAFIERHVVRDWYIVRRE